MDEWFLPILYWTSDYLFMHGLTLNHVSKKGHSVPYPDLYIKQYFPVYSGHMNNLFEPKITWHCIELYCALRYIIQNYHLRMEIWFVEYTPYIYAAGIAFIYLRSDAQDNATISSM